MDQRIENFVAAYEWRRLDGSCVRCGAGRDYYHDDGCQIVNYLDPYVKKLLKLVEEEKAALAA